MFAAAVLLSVIGLLIGPAVVARGAGEHVERPVERVGLRGGGEHPVADAGERELVVALEVGLQDVLEPFHPTT